MNAADITDKLDLQSLRHRNWYILATSGGDSLYEGLDWLSNQLRSQKRTDPSSLTSALSFPLRWHMSNSVVLSARSCLYGLVTLCIAPCCTGADAACNQVFI